MKNNTFCNSVCPWAIRQSKQVSTWRGLVIAAGTIVTIVNPALGAAALKAVGVVVGVLDVAKNDVGK